MLGVEAEQRAKARERKREPEMRVRKRYFAVLYGLTDCRRPCGGWFVLLSFSFALFGLSLFLSLCVGIKLHSSLSLSSTMVSFSLPVVGGNGAQAQLFRWKDSSLFAFLEQVAIHGTSFSKIRATATKENNYHGMEVACFEKDRMKEKWACLKKYPNALRKKSAHYYDLLQMIQRSLDTSKPDKWTRVSSVVSHSPGFGKDTATSEMGTNAPMLPNEPVVRRVTAKYRRPVTRNQNPYLVGKKVVSKKGVSTGKKVVGKKAVSTGKKPPVPGDKKEKKQYPPTSVVFRAKYHSRRGDGCVVCRRVIRAGQWIHNCGTTTEAVWTHAGCEILN